jgi:DNA-binding GntR family transcriptional regulator
MLATIRPIRAISEPFGVLAQRSRNTPREHKKLMEAALSRGAKAVALLKQHIGLTADHVTSALAKMRL